MAFTDPQSITVNGSAKSMPLINRGALSTLYKTADGLFSFALRHLPFKKAGKGRLRHRAVFTQNKVVNDPITNQAADFDFVEVSIQIDRPEFGFTDVEIGYLTEGFKTWLSTANVTKICGQES